jgi:hypothetical protein
MKLFTKPKLSFTFLFILVTFFLKSQLPPPPPPPTGGLQPPCWPPPCIPIDGGITFLAVAGAAYASKKLYNKVKK